MIDTMSKEKEIAEILLQKGAVKLSLNPPFTWVSGIKSPIYCDNRVLISFVKERDQIVEAFLRIMAQKKLKADVIAGTATSAIPWAAWIAERLDLPLVYVRPQKKDYGAGKQIEGVLSPGSKVILIEDLISTGGSAINSALALRNEGKAQIQDVLAIFSYELLESLVCFKKDNLNLTTLTNFSVLLELFLERGLVNQQDYQEILKFTDNPRSWR